MLVRRLPVLSALLVLLLAAGRCTAAALLRSSGTRADGRLDSRSVLELVGRYSKARAETTAGITGHVNKAPERKSRSSTGLETQPRDPRHKEKIIKILTGPLSFNPKCRKHFNRLYHNTRDCTTPAYYRRCARLLIRLANSPRCIER
ncbi:ALK and LTK ligand 2-like [Scomber scombrus]|uniref:ALK and LTK ligand 2-like n=1 Tax=Scomber scombrus TaxID=13677 RepID=A0AAV1QGB1_SCOSC|nr:ALK and LTK ligand 1-like [Scomber scombrus]